MEGGDFDLVWRTGDSFSEGVGPGTDHTFGNATGHFLFAPAATADEAGDTVAKIESTEFLPAKEEDDCFCRLWHHFNATGVSKINLLTRYIFRLLIPKLERGKEPSVDLGRADLSTRRRWDHGPGRPNTPG